MAWTAWDYTLALLVAHNGVGLVGNVMALVFWAFDLFADRKLQRGKWPEWRLVRKALTQYVVESYLIFPLLGYYLLVPLLLTRGERLLFGLFFAVVTVP